MKRATNELDSMLDTGEERFIKKNLPKGKTKRKENGKKT